MNLQRAGGHVNSSVFVMDSVDVSAAPCCRIRVFTAGLYRQNRAETGEGAEDVAVSAVSVQTRGSDEGNLSQTKGRQALRRSLPLSL